MAERVGAGRKAWWVVVDFLVLIYAVFPVLWILSLSLKPTSTVKDGKLIPSSVTFDNYLAIFRSDVFGPALRNRRDPAARNPAGLIYHARQGESCDYGIGADGRGSSDRQ